MKICYFLPWYSPARIGGTEIYILQLSKVVEQNNDVLIICPSSANTTERFDVQGIPIIASSTILEEPSSFKVKMGILPPPQLKEFDSFLQEIRPDILHFHCFWPSQIFYLEAAHKLGIKTIITPHLAGFTCLRDDLMREGIIPCDGKVLIERCSHCLLHNRSKGNVPIQEVAYGISKTLFKAGIHTGYSNKVSRLFSIPFFVKNKLDILKRIRNASNAIIAISPWYQKDLLINGFEPGKVRLILTSTYFQADPIVPEHQTDILKICFIGRQNREKGLDILLNALSLIPNEKVQLHLFGKVYPGLFENEVSDLRSKGYHIHQHGEMSHPVMLEELKKMDLLCLPTPGKEMAPLVIKEAFAFGIPVIGSDLGGITDAITEGTNGFLFGHSNHIDLASKIHMLINDPRLLKQMKLATVNSLVKSDTADQHMRLYQELLHAQNQSGMVQNSAVING
jgi:glycosyltransferase involved in cell wall biosynthesis